jgi:methylmalonyl-CoA mutase N-terminal domain/subunit
MDEALGLPTERAALLALRTQQVIAHETGIADTVDPLAGSYFVEALTDAIEADAREYIAKIDAMGGATSAIERGFQQREIHEAAYRWQKQVETGDAVVVGVNRFCSSDAMKPPILTVDASAESARREKLAALRRRRDARAVEAALALVGDAARTDANLMPPILSAVEAQATLGEIADRLRAVFGTHHETFAF